MAVWLRVPKGLLAGVGPLLLAAALAPAARAQVDCRMPGEDCSLREAAAQAGVRIGAAVSDFFDSDPAYGPALAADFDSLTAENDMKWAAIQPSLGSYDFVKADRLVDFAEANDMAVRGHTLLWDQETIDSTPAYVTAITDPAELRALVQDHIATLVGRYAGRVDAWDVVNEPFETTGSTFYDNVFHQVLGPGYIAEALTLAHAADPDALLFVNEVLISYQGAKFDAMLALAQDLLAQGAPLHGIGIQAHFLLTAVPEQLHANLLALAELGLVVELTELDVPFSTSQPDAAEEQRRVYLEVARACLAVPACRRITLWGFTDAHTWIDSFIGPDFAPLPLDKDYQRKPAWFGLREGLLSRTAPLAGKKLVFRDPSTNPEKRKLSATSRDETVLALHEGGTADPTLTGASLEVTAERAGAPFAQQFELPASRWTRKGKSYRYRDRKGELGPVRQVRLRDARKLSLRLQGSGLDLGLTEDPAPIDIVLRTGNASHCMRFGGTEKFEPGKTFRAKSAEAPGVCPPP
jgi:endo-1,4-beta-xylanase